MGLIRDVMPSTNRILKMLLPTTLPIAISHLPFLAAVIEVAISGSDVPRAIIVTLIMVSLTPQDCARLIAL